jgi:excisionase family DNA binding protein
VEVMPSFSTAKSRINVKRENFKRMDLSYEFSQVRKELAAIKELLKSTEANSGTLKTYDLADLQNVLKVSRRTISTWTKEGILPHTKVGNKIWVTEEQLKAFLKSNSMNERGFIINKEEGS